MRDGQRQAPLIIAHRGASGYLPEHTLEAKALAYGLGADYLEQDVVVSRDDRLIVLHDIHLDRVTDVAAVFPGRARDDGRYYVRDFDLDELRQLRVWERFSDTAGQQAVFPGRFPARTGRFRLNTLDEELAMVVGLNRATGRRVGVYPEIKSPAWHHAEGVDSAALVLEVLAAHGFRDPADPVFVQCFDAAELRRIREELGTPLPLVQLLGDNSWRESATDYDYLQTAEGLAEVAEYADGCGPWIRQLYTREPIAGEPVTTGFVARAHAAGLVVHPYTFRADAVDEGFANFAAQVRWCVRELAVDGLFTDFPDRARAALRDPVAEQGT